MPDPFTTAALDLFETAFVEMGDCLTGLGATDLNRRPLASDSNSLAALAVHSLTSTRSWLCVALGRPLPDRDRNAEFQTEAAAPEQLASIVSDLQSDCLAYLREGPSRPWADERGTHARSDPDASETVTGAWALMHAIEHLREHLGQMWLTRQLLDGKLGPD